MQTGNIDNMCKRVLVVGANGFTGRRIMNMLATDTDYQVSGCSLHPDLYPHAGNYRFIEADICDEKAVNRLFEECNPDVVINTAALSAPDYCESHHKEADALNIHAVAHLAKACEEQGGRFIQLSTDFVFGGNRQRLYMEEDLPNPVNYYGLSKWRSEQHVQALCSDYAIARVVVVYGNPLPGQHGNIVRLVARRLKDKETIRVVSDQWRTPTYVGDVSAGIEKLVEHNGNGIYHICGDECLTIADVAHRTAEVLGLDSSLILPVNTHEMDEKTPRPPYSGLDIGKARRELGYCPHTLDDGIRLSTSGCLQ